MSSPNTIQCPYCLKCYPIETETCDCGYSFRGTSNAESLICPVCHKFAPPGTLFCDCGYDFSKGSDTLKNRNKAITISCIITIIGFIMGMIIMR